MSWNSMQDGRYTKTYVSISGVDYTEEMMGFKMESDIEGESKSSVFGSINVENLEFTINGKLPNYEQEYAEIKFGLYTRNLVFGEEVPYTVREYSSFVITEQEYDDKSDETKFKAMTDVRALDEKVTIPLASTTNEVINGTLKAGESVVLPSLNLPIADTSDKYYERRMDLYQDIAAITGTYIDVEYIDGDLRYVFRDFGRKASQSALDSLEGFIQDGSSIYKDFSVVSGDHYSTTLEVRNTGQGQATISFEGFGSHTIEAGQYKVINFIGQATKNTYRLTLSGDIDIIAYSQPSEVPVFELEIGETMAPIDTVHLRYPSGDNVSLGDESSGIVFEDIEIIKDRREELLPDILGRIQGMSYTDYDVEYPGDPFIRIGEIVTVADKDGLYHDVYVTASTLEDNGAWQGKLSAKIVDLEAVETNYVGTYDKAISETGIKVDKVSQEIDLVVRNVGDQDDKIAAIRTEVESVVVEVGKISTSNNLIGSLDVGLNTYDMWDFREIEGRKFPIVQSLNIKNNGQYEVTINHLHTVQPNQYLEYYEEVPSYIGIGVLDIRGQYMDIEVDTPHIGYVGENLLPLPHDFTNFDMTKGSSDPSVGNMIPNGNLTTAIPMSKFSGDTGTVTSTVGSIKIDTNPKTNWVSVELGDISRVGRNLWVRLEGWFQTSGFPRPSLSGLMLTLEGEPNTYVDIPLDTSNLTSGNFVFEEEIYVGLIEANTVTVSLRYQENAGGVSLDLNHIRLSPYQLGGGGAELIQLPNGKSRIVSGSIPSQVYYSMSVPERSDFGTPMFEDLSIVSTLPMNSTFMVSMSRKSLSTRQMSFGTPGIAIPHGLAYIVPDNEYSFNTMRVAGTHAFTVHTLEYNKEMELLLERSHLLGDGLAYEYFTFMPTEETYWVGLEIETHEGVSVGNPLVLADMMITRGNPSAYKENIGDFKAASEARFQVLDDRINSTVEEVSIQDGKWVNIISEITQAAREIKISAESIKFEGMVTANNNVEIRTDGTIKAVNALFENATISGKLRSGSVGNWLIDGDIVSQNGKLRLDGANGNIEFNDVILQAQSTELWQGLRMKDATDASGGLYLTVFGNRSQVAYIEAGDPGNITSIGKTQLGDGLVMLGIGDNNMAGLYVDSYNDGTFVSGKLGLRADFVRSKYYDFGTGTFELSVDSNGFVKGRLMR